MDIIDKIEELVRKTMCVEYVSDLTLEIDGDEYNLLLDLNQWRAPLSIAYQGTEDGFLKYLEKEFQSRQLQKTKYFKGIQTTPGIGNQYIIFDYGNRERSQ